MSHRHLQLCHHQNFMTRLFCIVLNVLLESKDVRDNLAWRAPRRSPSHTHTRCLGEWQAGHHHSRSVNLRRPSCSRAAQLQRGAKPPQAGWSLIILILLIVISSSNIKKILSLSQWLEQLSLQYLNQHIKLPVVLALLITRNFIFVYFLFIFIFLSYFLFFSKRGPFPGMKLEWERRPASISADHSAKAV